MLTPPILRKPFSIRSEKTPVEQPKSAGPGLTKKPRPLNFDIEVLQPLDEAKNSPIASVGDPPVVSAALAAAESKRSVAAPAAAAPAPAAAAPAVISIDREPDGLLDRMRARIKENKDSATTVLYKFLIEWAGTAFNDRVDEVWSGNDPGTEVKAENLEHELYGVVTPKAVVAIRGALEWIRSGGRSATRPIDKLTLMDHLSNSGLRDKFIQVMTARQFCIAPMVRTSMWANSKTVDLAGSTLRQLRDFYNNWPE